MSFGHSTPSMAAQFAVETSAKRLCLIHLSPRYRPITSFPPAGKTVTSADVQALLKTGENAELLRHEAETWVKKAGADCQVHVAEDFMVLEVPQRKP